MANKTSPHILSTAANLLGFRLFVITSLHIANQSQGTLIDEFTSVVAVLLSGSCVFSFFSIRTSDAKTEQRLETIADYLFYAFTGRYFADHCIHHVSFYPVEPATKSSKKVAFSINVGSRL